MSKYIKLEDAIHNINLEVIGRKEYTGDMKANLFFALDDLPTIEVVRCKDCKHWNDFYSKCTKWTVDTYEQAQTNAEDFCSYGERKDNE